MFKFLSFTSFVRSAHEWMPATCVWHICSQCCLHYAIRHEDCFHLLVMHLVSWVRPPKYIIITLHAAAPWCRCFLSPWPFYPDFWQSLCTDDTRPATPIPSILASMGQRIATDLNIVDEFDQLTVNTYNPGEVRYNNRLALLCVWLIFTIVTTRWFPTWTTTIPQGIASHVETHSVFGPTLVSLSLGGSVIMDFHCVR